MIDIDGVRQILKDCDIYDKENSKNFIPGADCLFIRAAKSSKSNSVRSLFVAPSSEVDVIKGKRFLGKFRCDTVASIMTAQAFSQIP